MLITNFPKQTTTTKSFHTTAATDDDHHFGNKNHFLINFKLVSHETVKVGNFEKTNSAKPEPKTKKKLSSSSSTASTQMLEKVAVQYGNDEFQGDFFR